MSNNESLCEYVYLVTFSDWDEHDVVSAWTTEEAADADRARLSKGKKGSGSFGVEPVRLNVESENYVVG